MQTQTVGRPSGSKQKLPPGHVGVGGLAALLGVSSASIPAMERRGDPRIPPRSPLAGFGTRRRAIWRVIDVEDNTAALAALRPAPQRPGAVAPNAFWPAQQDERPAPRREGGPGRPRGTGKNRK